MILFICLILIKMQMGLLNFLNPIIPILNSHLKNQHFLKNSGIYRSGIYEKMVYVVIGLYVVNLGLSVFLSFCLSFCQIICFFRAFHLPSCFRGIDPLVCCEIQHVFELM